MAKATKPLTAKRIEHLRKPGRYNDGHGLHLQITPAGVKSWLLRYERHGRERWMGLGPIHTVGLKEARERARNARLQLLDGIDPLDARRAARAAAALEAARMLSFEEAAKQYYGQHQAKWKNPKAAAQFLSSLKAYAFLKIGGLSVADIDTGQVLRCLEPIWASKTETASRVRGRIEAVLDWAQVRGYRTGDNPARWKGHLAEVLPARSKVQRVKHHKALPWAQVPAFMAELREREGVAARALEFTVLTAARSGETLGAKWSEIDLDNKTWTVPAERMKAGREHVVPLSKRALEILRSLPREKHNDFVFVGGRRGGLSDMAMSATLKRMGVEAVTHGFRSSFRDWVGERTSYAHEVAEFALAHGIPDKAQAAYRRYRALDKRLKLMDAWAAFCASPTASGKTVVSLRKSSP
jgi:integrase